MDTPTGLNFVILGNGVDAVKVPIRQALCQGSE